MDKEIKLTPIAFVKNTRVAIIDDNWSTVTSEIELAENLPEECFDNIDTFSHLEIIFHLNQTNKTIIGSEHPRNNTEWPKVGIFAQRKKDRPNHLGLTIVNLIKREGRKLTVTTLDAIDGTPILDIKPVLKEFLPQGEVFQPKWSHELMKNYWIENK